MGRGSQVEGVLLPRAEVVRGGALAILWAEWDDLADRVGAPPWLRPGWVSAWRRAFGDGELAAFTLRRGGRLAALVPVEERRGMLCSPTNWHTPGFGFLAEDHRAAAELATELIAAGRRRLSLGFVAGGGVEVEAARAAAAAAGYRTSTRVLARSPFVGLDGGWDDYVRGLARSHVKDLRRRRRRLEDHGRVAFQVLDGSERLGELLEEGFGLEQVGWKKAGRTAIVSSPRTLAFYTGVARWAAARGTLRLAFLRLERRAVAFELMLEEAGSLYDLKGGYDETYASCSPGMLLIREIIAYGFARGLTSYEFLGTDEAYKRKWTETVRERVLFQAFAPSAPGLFSWAASAYARPLARRMTALATLATRSTP